jgi:hypothetical protein
MAVLEGKKKYEDASEEQKQKWRREREAFIIYNEDPKSKNAPAVDENARLSKRGLSTKNGSQ